MCTIGGPTACVLYAAAVPPVCSLLCLVVRHMQPVEWQGVEAGAGWVPGELSCAFQAAGCFKAAPGPAAAAESPLSLRLALICCKHCWGELRCGSDCGSGCVSHIMGCGGCTGGWEYAAARDAIQFGLSGACRQPSQLMLRTCGHGQPHCASRQPV